AITSSRCRCRYNQFPPTLRHDPRRPNEERPMPEAPHLTELTGEYQCLHEFIPAARAKLDSNFWVYLIGATESETTLRRNRAALDAIALRPRVLRNVSNVDCTTNFLGMKLRLPVMLAPVGSLESFHPGGAA